MSEILKYNEFENLSEMANISSDISDSILEFNTYDDYDTSLTDYDLRN